MIEPISLDSPIEAKITWAKECMRAMGAVLRGDGRIASLRERLGEAIEDSHAEMMNLGIPDECRDCEEKRGGSCCGKGLENYYSGNLLLINLLLGKDLPTERFDGRSCFFLGSEGCRLGARDVICINYLCDEITSRFPAPRVASLREKEGIEIRLLFELNESIRALLTATNVSVSPRRPSLRVHQGLSTVASYYDRKKVGDSGSLGFRRSTDLAKLCTCLERMLERDLFSPGESTFMDLGCADGRVNVLLSYLTRLSIGIELNEWILEEYEPLRRELENVLIERRLPPPPRDVFLFHGDSTDESLHETIREKTGADFGDVDLFYTYLTMQEEFAALIARKAKIGALFMVYGLDRILPQCPGLKLLTPDWALEGILALYRKE
jgi:hypothetical protein